MSWLQLCTFFPLLIPPSAGRGEGHLAISAEEKYKFSRNGLRDFFSLIVFDGAEVLIVYILRCHPSEDSQQGRAIPDDSRPIRTDGPL